MNLFTDLVLKSLMITFKIRFKSDSGFCEVICECNRKMRGC